MPSRSHPLKIALFGTFLGPPFFLAVGILLYALGIALAVLCVIFFPVMGIFFPQKLLEFATPTKDDREIAKRVQDRLDASL